MTYPILEYDPAPNAFIEPSNVVKPRDMPEHCIICFFREVIDKVIDEHDARVLVENRWEDGPHPVYEISYQNQRLAFFHPGIGAPWRPVCSKKSLHLVVANSLPVVAVGFSKKVLR